MSRALPLPCPACGLRAGVEHVHGHGQCLACGTNVDPCCTGDTGNDAATTTRREPGTGPGDTPPALFPLLFQRLGGERATVTTDALLFAMTQRLDCDLDEARLVLEAAERIGLVRTQAPGLHRLHA